MANPDPDPMDRYIACCFPSKILHTVSYLGAIMGFAALTLLSSVAHASGKPDNPINLNVTTHLGDTRTFREGDIVSFYVNLDRDAYLVIVYQDAAEHLFMILPNSMYSDNFYKAGLFIPIPNEHNPFRFRIAAPFGKETLWIFASDHPLPAAKFISSDSNTVSNNGDISEILDSFSEHSRRLGAVLETTSLTLYTTPETPAP